MAFCSNCGFLLKEGMKFCGNCGKAVPVEEPAAAVEPAVTSTVAAEPVALAQQVEPVSMPAQSVQSIFTRARAVGKKAVGVFRKWSRKKKIIAVGALSLPMAIIVAIIVIYNTGGNSGQTGQYNYNSPSSYGAFGYYEKSDFITIETFTGNKNIISYWLYNTYREHNGDGKPLYKAFERYANSLGYYVDSDNIYISGSLPKAEFIYRMSGTSTSSVVELMNRYDADVAMTVGVSRDNKDYVYIVNYDKDKRLYWQERWPLQKRN